MSWRDREGLRKYFSEGSRPTAEHFAELIESTVNIAEDGISKNATDGLRLEALVGHRALMSFYRGKSTEEADWSMSFGNEDRQLLFSSGRAEGGEPGAALLSMQPGPRSNDPDRAGQDSGGRVGVYTTTPRRETRLDVNGVVGASGRLGREPDNALEVVADGRPYVLVDKLRGCQAFEVMAGTGRPKASGQFALLHAVAMNAYNPSRWDDLLGRKKTIRHQHAYFSRRCERLQLFWDGEPGGTYRLCIRSRCDYAAAARNKLKKGEKLDAASEVRIRVYLTKLWFDDMADADEDAR